MPLRSALWSPPPITRPAAHARHFLTEIHQPDASGPEARVVAGLVREEPAAVPQLKALLAPWLIIIPVR
jgi:hypothetical protein